MNKLAANFWRPTMVDGVIHFPRPEQCPVKKEIRDMMPKRFGIDHNLRNVDAEAMEV